MVDELEMLPVWAGRKKEAAQPPEGFAATLDQGPVDLVDPPSLPVEPELDFATAEGDLFLSALEQDVELDEPALEPEPPPQPQTSGEDASAGAAPAAQPSTGSAARFVVIAALSLMAGLLAGYLYLVLLG